MAGSVNKVILVGNLGRDPEIRTMQSGSRVANLSIATSESWKDKTSGERRERTEWHRVTVFSDGLVNVIENYIKKGSKVYIEGQLETRKWQDQSGADRYTTEVVLRGYGSSFVMLDGRNDSQGGGSSYGGGEQQNNQVSNQSQQSNSHNNAAQNTNAGMEDFADIDDDIPF